MNVLKQQNKHLATRLRIYNSEAEQLKNENKLNINRSETKFTTEKKPEGSVKKKSNFNNKLVVLKALCKSKDRIISTLTKKNFEFKSNANVSEKQLRLLRDQVKTKTQCLKDLRLKMKSCKKSVAESDNQNNLYIGKLERKNNVITNLQHQIDNLNMKLEWQPISKKEKIHKLQEKCKKLEKLLRKSNKTSLSGNQGAMLTNRVKEVMINNSDKSKEIHHKTIHETQTAQSLASMFNILQELGKNLESRNLPLRKECSRNGSTMSRLSKGHKSRPPTFTIPGVSCPQSVAKEGMALCHYISNLVEEHVGLKLTKKLQLQD